MKTHQFETEAMRVRGAVCAGEIIRARANGCSRALLFPGNNLRSAIHKIHFSSTR
jgi:hypothetical protein